MANLQLKPDKAQAKSLRDTLERCNAGCNAISQRGFEAGKTRKYDLQKLLYFDIRKEFGLTAQAAIRCLAKVGDACIECGYKAVADFVGARNIRALGAETLRNQGSLSSAWYEVREMPSPGSGGQKPPPSGRG